MDCSNPSIWGVIISIVFGLIYYISNWKERRQLHILIATFLLIICVLVLIVLSGWFTICN